jgi:hypothetical protein
LYKFTSQLLSTTLEIEKIKNFVSILAKNMAALSSLYAVAVFRNDP